VMSDCEVPAHKSLDTIGDLQAGGIRILPVFPGKIGDDQNDGYQK